MVTGIRTQRLSAYAYLSKKTKTKKKRIHFLISHDSFVTCECNFLSTGSPSCVAANFCNPSEPLHVFLVLVCLSLLVWPQCNLLILRFCPCYSLIILDFVRAFCLVLPPCSRSAYLSCIDCFSLICHAQWSVCVAVQTTTFPSANSESAHLSGIAKGISQNM